jgi:hypothetical protein
MWPAERVRIGGGSMYSFQREAGSSHTPSPGEDVAMIPLVPMKTLPLPVRMPGCGGLPDRQTRARPGRWRRAALRYSPGDGCRVRALPLRLSRT